MTLSCGTSSLNSYRPTLARTSSLIGSSATAYPALPIHLQREVVWKGRLGVVDELEAQGIANTGAPNVGGPIATSSGLVLIGATGDKRFHAFDAKSGKELWGTKLDAAQPQRPSHIKAKMASSTWSWLREGRPTREFEGNLPQKLVTFSLP